MTSPLHTYLRENAIIHPSKTENSSDVHFFSVTAGPKATADGFRSVIRQHKGVFCACKPLDGEEHSYIELGGWVGDQQSALAMIGLGDSLKVWRSLTPRNVLGDLITPDQADLLAGNGMVAAQVPPAWVAEQ